VFEWEKNKEILIASGNAKASRGGITVLAEVLRAYYRKKTTGGTDLIRLDAAGGVKIFSDTESMKGQTAVLDFEQAILKVDGKKVIYKAGPDTITANQQMEYWERQKMAIARGNAVAIHKGKTLRADVLKALLRKNKTGRSEVYEIEAFNNVLIVSDKDRLSSDSAIYKLDSGIATLKNNVSIVREDSNTRVQLVNSAIRTQSILVTDNENIVEGLDFINFGTPGFIFSQKCFQYISSQSFAFMNGNSISPGYSHLLAFPILHLLVGGDGVGACLVDHFFAIYLEYCLFKI
jgi:lipopolysaccharide export system protein LptA